MRWCWRAGLVMCIGAAQPVARADSWMPPCPKAYLSPSGDYRLIVMPQGHAPGVCAEARAPSPLAGRSAPDDGVAATLERREQGRWTAVWQRRLPNRVSPVDAAVSDQGQVATFDDWYGTGYGSRVVVLYDAAGQPIRQFGLAGFLPKAYVNALPRSVSSIMWGGGHAFTPDGRQLRLQVVVPDADPDRPGPWTGEPPRVPVFIDARSGAVETPGGPAWKQAMAQAGQADRVRCAEQRQAFGAALVPLPALSPQSAPAEFERHGWQAAERLRSRDAEYLLRASCTLSGEELGQPAKVEACVRRAVDEASGKPAEVLIQAADPGRLWLAAERLFAALPPGVLAGSTLYLAAPQDQHASVLHALAHLGATVALFDPMRPVTITPAARALLLAPFDPLDGRTGLGECGPFARP